MARPPLGEGMVTGSEGPPPVEMGPPRPPPVEVGRALCACTPAPARESRDHAMKGQAVMTIPWEGGGPRTCDLGSYIYIHTFVFKLFHLFIRG